MQQDWGWWEAKRRMHHNMLDSMRAEYDLAMATELDGRRFAEERLERLRRYIAGLTVREDFFSHVDLDVDEADSRFRMRYPGVVTSLWETISNEAHEEMQGGATKGTMQDTLEVRYIAIAKSRKGGWSCAGILHPAKSKEDWKLILPVSVIMDWFGAAMAKPVEHQSYYELLGLANTSPSRGEVKKAYHRYAKQWHPDYCREPGATERFQRLVEAYGVLVDPSQRKKYDAILRWKEDYSKDERDKSSVYGVYKASSQTYTLEEQEAYQPPLRCGFIHMRFHMSGRWYIADEILGWDDIISLTGEVLSTSWGRDGLVESWV